MTITNNRREQMLRVARLYYIDGIEQNQIAKKEMVSRATVSRLLATARDKGFVTIKVNDDLRDAQVLGDQLEKIYPKVTFKVASTSQDDTKTKQNRVASLAAKYLDTIVKSGDIIGVGSGEEVFQVSQLLETKSVQDVTVTALTGIFDSENYPTHQNDIMSLFVKKYHATERVRPLPIIFNDLSTKKMVEKEKHIKYLEKLSRLSNIVLFTVNDLEHSSLLDNQNYLSDQEKSDIISTASGEILAHYIDFNGKPVNQNLDMRTVSLPLNNLHFKDNGIIVVSDVSKYKMLYLAITKGFVSEVFIDQQTAQRLLDFDNAQ